MSKDKIIVALDNMSEAEIINFIEKTHHDFSFYKIGMQSFYAYGRKTLELISQKYGAKIFLDLKLHDIPNTVAGAIESLKGLPIEFLTLHLSGGVQMCRRAVQARDEFLPGTKLLGVSLLTSLGEKDFLGLWQLSDEAEVKKQMQRLISIGIEANLDAMVCSAHELDIERGNLKAVCPGIRFADEIQDNTTQDQTRVMTPDQALNAGADYLVMGRSLTKAKDLEARIAQLNY